MNLSLFAGSPFAKTYGAELAAHGLAVVPVKDCFASAFLGKLWLKVLTDLAVTRERVAAFSPRDAEPWDRLVADFPPARRHASRCLAGG